MPQPTSSCKIASADYALAATSSRLPFILPRLTLYLYHTDHSKYQLHIFEQLRANTLHATV